MIIDVQWDLGPCVTATLRYQGSSKIEGCADIQEEMPGLTSARYDFSDLQLNSTYIINLEIISNDASLTSIRGSSTITIDGKGL